MQPRQYRLLQNILSQPTAPFREAHVVRAVVEALRSAKVPFFQDPAGNLVVGVADRAAYRRVVRTRSREPLRVFIAHMDHPGFHGVGWTDSGRLRVRWHGGSPVKYLGGSHVWLGSDEGVFATGRLTHVQLSASRRSIDTAEVRLGAPLPTNRRPGARRLYGGFSFRSPLWRRGRRVYTRAADDLTGVFAVVETARAMAAQRPSFLGLLTRGEEVGFVGAVAHLELGWLRGAQRPVLCVSLEASRTLPGAKVGKGPVVRLGDRRTVFDPGALKILADVAQRALPGAHQSRIMDGGACEASAATAYGLTTVGVSVPLGNYHNEGYEGGPDCRGPRGPAPEFVDLDDVVGELHLCRALLRPGLAWDDAWAPQRKRLIRNVGRYQRLLAQTPRRNR